MNNIIIAIIAASVLVIGGTAAAVVLAHQDEDDRPVIAVTMAWQKDMVESIAGDGYKVVSMMDANTSPHETYSTPKNVADLYKSSIYFTIGTEVEWEEAFMKDVESKIPDTVKIVKIGERTDYVPLTSTHHHHGEGDAVGGHGEEETDAHIWTSPAIMRNIAKVVAAELSSYFENDGERFQKNLDAYGKRINAMDESVRALVGKVETPAHVMVWHPAWQYFLEQYCRDLGLELHMEAVEADGEVTTEDVIKMLKTEDAKAVYVSVTDEGYENMEALENAGIEVRVVNPTSEDILKSVEEFIGYLEKDLPPKAST